MQQQDRTRIFSHITRTRFLHLEDALAIGKIRFFIGEYQRGSGAQATAYHFLDLADARPIMADLSWSRPLDIKDYKGSANGSDGPLSRVLRVKGPKDGKYWLEIHNGPGEIIGQGAVKPSGEPDTSISIALSVYEARKLALATIEYMQAYRVATLIGVANLDSRRHVDTSTGEISDVEALFGTEPAPIPASSPKPCHQKEPAQAETPAEVDPPTFFALANKAIKSGFDLARLREIINDADTAWREKHISLAQAMAA